MFYIYQPTAIVQRAAPSHQTTSGDSLQTVVIKALQDAETVNALTFNSNRSLSDTLAVARSMDPSLTDGNAARLAQSILSMQTRMRANIYKSFKAKMKNSASFRGTQNSSRLIKLPTVK